MLPNGIAPVLISASFGGKLGDLVTSRKMFGGVGLYCRGVFFGSYPAAVADAAQKRFIRGQLIGGFAPDQIAHAVRQDAIGIGDGRDDARDICWWSLTAALCSRVSPRMDRASRTISGR